MLIDVVLPCLDEAAALPWVLGRMPPGFRGKARRAALDRLETARRWIRQLSQEAKTPGPASAATSKRR